MKKINKLVQFSSAQGPLECSLAVKKASKYFIEILEKGDIFYKIINQVDDLVGFKSILLDVEIPNDAFIKEWSGTHLWIWKSDIRPKYPRKNWFFGVTFSDLPPLIPESEIMYKAIMSQGAGGQHVNKTASAIQATHTATGVTVKVQAERSQHANKRLANILIQQKLNEMLEEDKKGQSRVRRMAHHQLERGNPQKVFIGDKFQLRI